MPTINVLDSAAATVAVELPNVNGQATMANSRPVVIASNQSAVPTYADNYGKTVASNTITRLANTTAYAAQQVIGGSATAGFTSNGFTFSSFSRTSGGVVRIERARLYKSQGTLTGIFELRIYRAQPTLTVGDAGASATGVPVGNASTSARLVGRIQFDFTAGVVGSDGAEVAAIPVAGAPITSTLAASDVFAVLVAVGAYTPVSGETFSAVLEGYAF